MDHSILFFIQENLRYDWLNPIMKAITVLGNPIGFFTVLGFALLLFQKTRKYGYVVLIALVIEVIMINLGLKNIVRRVRPYDRFYDLNRLIEAQKDFSFPSGHSGISMAVSCALYFSLPKEKKIMGYILIGIAILVCYSRLYLGVHYPTDVITGIVIGIFSGFIAWKVALRTFLSSQKMSL